MSEVFETAGIGLAEQAVSRAYASMRFSSQSEQRGFRLAQTLTDPAGPPGARDAADIGWFLAEPSGPGTNLACVE